MRLNVLLTVWSMQYNVHFRSKMFLFHFILSALKIKIAGRLLMYVKAIFLKKGIEKGRVRPLVLNLGVGFLNIFSQCFWGKGWGWVVCGWYQ